MVPDLLLIGASTRALAGSAIRAGFHPYCIDLFADVDLLQMAEVEVLPQEEYPAGFPQRLQRFPSHIPVCYTGGLENYPSVYEELAQQRPVWGYLKPAPMHGKSIRSPRFLDELADRAGFCRPSHSWDKMPTAGNWLLKPFASAGGRGIRHWKLGQPVPPAYYLEEYLTGPSLSATFCRLEHDTLLLGITVQLLGCAFCHAPQPFSYVGNIGPAMQDNRVEEQLRSFGDSLVEADPFLRGLFGVDLIVHKGRLYLIEVNPRYTASVEVLEMTGGISLLSLAAQAFGQQRQVSRPHASLPSMGKAVYFAPSTVQFPRTGPWMGNQRPDVWKIPEYADIPQAGSIIQPGQPVLTLYAVGTDGVEVHQQLETKARELDELLAVRM